MKKSLLFIVIILLVGCTTVPDAPVIGKVNDLYNKGMDALQAGKYETAIHTFEELERQHPYSGWATRAQMMVAYTHFKAQDFDLAVAATERFIRLHPGHSNLDYIFYLRGLSYYHRISDVRRDQGYTRYAMQSFEELVQRFPESIYARDAKLKLTLCRDHLAGKEMDVGRYYQGQKRYLAALNRFKTVLKEYEKSSQTPEALYRLTETYLALGVNDEAKRSAAILGHNYAESTWYKEAYELLTKRKLAPVGKEKSWYNQISKGISDLF